MSHRITTNDTRRLASRTILTATGALLIATGLAACAPGHGKHTTKFIKEREQAKAVMKAATAYDMAHQAYLAGDLDKAISHIDDSIAMNDEVAKSHVLKGRILLEMTEFQGALTSLDRAVELDEENDEAPYFKGIIYERIAQPDQALVAFQQAAEIAPNNAQYAVAVAEVLIDLDRVDDAWDYLERDDASYRHNAGVNQTLGHIALMQDDPQKAVECFEQARLLAPENEAIMEDLAMAQMRVGQFAEADYIFSRILAKEENAERRDLMHLRARCLMQVDRPVEAREVLLQLTDGDAGQADVDAWVELGNVAYKLSDMARLRTAATRVVALAPDRFEGFLLKGLWERAQGHPDRALKSLNRAIQLRGDDVTPLIVTGIVQRELGDVRGAREVLLTAAREDPDNETVHEFISLLDTQNRAVATHPDDQ